MATQDEQIEIIRMLARDFDDDIKNDGVNLNLDDEEWLLFLKRFTYEQDGTNYISLLDCAIEYCAIRAGHYKEEQKQGHMMTLRTQRYLKLMKANNPQLHVYESTVEPLEG